MDECTLLPNSTPSPSNFTFTLLARPLGYIWTPGSEDVDSIELMVERMIATQNLIQGNLHPEDYLDLLDSQGFDVYGLLDGIEAECYQ